MRSSSSQRLLAFCAELFVLSVQLSCGGGGNGSTSAPPPAAPAISSFTATPASITSGNSSTLAWTVSGATSLNINPSVGTVTGLGNQIVHPTTTTMYTLTASNPGGSASASVTVTVVPSPVITDFVATPAAILDGQSSTLSWNATGASTLSLDQGIGTVTGASKTVSPTTTTTYTLTATNSLGSTTTATATVTVNLNLGGTLSLTYVPGSSVKLEQVIGDKDWADAAKGITTPTTSQTITRSDVLGCGLGATFEANGQCIVLFGDTIGATAGPPLGPGPAYYPTWVPFYNNFRHLGRDAFGWSTSTDPESGLLVNFYTKSDGSPLLVEPPGVDMGPDNIPNSGITLDGQIYIVCSTGTAVNAGIADYSNDFSVLSTFDPASRTFTTLRTISRVNAGGHFLITSQHEAPPGSPSPQAGFPGPAVYMFGLGLYRQSNIYLSAIPKNGFATGTGTLYFAGLVNGLPTWTTQEMAAVPVVSDIVPNNPTIGNFSVVYSSTLHLWLMAFDGGRQQGPQIFNTSGFYFSYAPEPWGPWSEPQLMYNAIRDHGLGVYIRDPNSTTPAGPGPAGPTIGDQTVTPPDTTRGADFAPEMIERFLTVDGDTLKVYYLMSTWNPYTVVKMRSNFIVANP